MCKVQNIQNDIQNAKTTQFQKRTNVNRQLCMCNCWCNMNVIWTQPLAWRLWLMFRLRTMSPLLFWVLFGRPGRCRDELVVVIPAKNDQLDSGHTVVLSVAFHIVGTEWNSLPLWNSRRQTVTIDGDVALFLFVSGQMGENNNLEWTIANKTTVGCC